MFKSLDELKHFILWSESKGIQHFKIDNVEIVFGANSMLPEDSKKLIEDHYKSFGDNKASDMSLENPFLFDAVR